MGEETVDPSVQGGEHISRDELENSIEEAKKKLQIGKFPLQDPSAPLPTDPIEQVLPEGQDDPGDSRLA